MASNYERCGEIVWQYKRKARSFAFKCSFCVYITTTFRDFKKHLESKHSKQLTDVENETAQSPLARRNVVKQLSPPASPSADPTELDPLQKACNSNGESADDNVAANADIGDPTELDPLKKSYNSLEESDADVAADDGLITSENEQAESNEVNMIDSAKYIFRGQVYPLSFFDGTSDDEPGKDYRSDSSSSSSDSLAYGQQEPHKETPQYWLREHPIMIAIIEEFKNTPILWDTTLGQHKNHKIRNEIFEGIASKINALFELELTCQDICLYTQKLRAAYWREQRRVLLSSVERETPLTPQWYYQRLSFLGNSYRQRNKTAYSSKQMGLPIAQLSHEQNCTLIELYERCKNLWDTQNMACRLRHVRQAANDELLQLCHTEMKLDIDKELLQRYIYRIRHAYTREKVRQLRCEQKGRTFKPTCAYYQQIQFLNEHVGPFKCEVCDLVINGVDRFKIHQSEHDGSMPFVCPICQRCFSRSGNCTIHLRRHTQDFHVECKECGKRFATTSDMQVHRRYHTGEKPYCCDVCGQRFRTSSFFDRHKRRHEQRPKAKCHICGKCFFEQSALKDHLKNKNHLNVRDKVCDICNKTFTSAKYLRQHKEIHAANKRYACKICDKRFAQYAGLSGHMKSHGTTVSGAKLLSGDPAANPDGDHADADLDSTVTTIELQTYQ